MTERPLPRAVVALALALAGCGGASGAGECTPGERACRSGEVWACRADGTAFEWVVACPAASTTCVDGACAPLGFHDAVDEPAPPDAIDEPRVPDPGAADPGRDPAPDPGSPDALPDPGPVDPGSPEPEAAPPDAPAEADAPPIPDILPDGPRDLAGPEPVETSADAAPDPGPEPLSEPLPEVADEPVAAGCGDGVVQAPEQCEPGKPLGKSCGQLGYASGALACRADCSFDTSGCDAMGALAYEKLPNLAFTDDFVDVAWRADGVEAWFVRANGGLVHYDPDTHVLTEVTLPAGLSVRRVVAVPFEPAVLLAGAVTSPATSARLYRYAPVDGSFTELEAFRLDGFEWIAGAFSPDGKQFVAGGTKPGSTPGNSLRWSAVPFGGDTLSQTWLTWPGLSDLTWGQGAEYDGTAFVLTSEGWNGGGSHDWVVAGNTLLQNTWGGYGNAGRGAWRPGGTCAVFAATSTTNGVYVDDDGVWSKASFPSPFFSVLSVSWNAAGTRLLAVGRAGGGVNLVGSVYEYRPSGTGYAPGAWVNQTIADFDTSPWLANSNTVFHHAAWRPHSDCAEGLIAASDNGASWSPTFGLALRFHDTADPACE